MFWMDAGHPEPSQLRPHFKFKQKMETKESLRRLAGGRAFDFINFRDTKKEYETHPGLKQSSYVDEGALCELAQLLTEPVSF